MPNQFEKDRLFSKGLPSSLSAEALQRIANPQKNTLARVAAHVQAVQDGFEPVPDADGLYIKAHNIWALKPAEQGEGYVLIRLHEERDVDHREAQLGKALAPMIMGLGLMGPPAMAQDQATKAVSMYMQNKNDPRKAKFYKEGFDIGPGPEAQKRVTELTNDPLAREAFMDGVRAKAQENAPKTGRRVSFVHKGQLAEAMVVFVHPSCELVDLALRGPEPKPEIVMAVPVNQLTDMGDPEVELVNDDPFEPASVPKGF